MTNDIVGKGNTEKVGNRDMKYLFLKWLHSNML